jgi:Domain of unknown function (DUF4331)
MKKFRMRYALAGAALLSVPLVFQFAAQPGDAADHLDPPARTDPAADSRPDPASDIADIYAFHDANRVVMILTFAGPGAATAPATYDPNVRYRINVSNAGSRTTTEFPIDIQFGRDTAVAGAPFGVRVRGVPGVVGDITGPVESTISRDGVRVRAGLFDDPFFFDLQGFRDTQSTGTLSFRNNRDFFAGTNLTAVVIEIPRARLANGTNPLDIWAETARLGGQL